MPVVAVSILNHGAAAATIACVDSLLAQQPDSDRPFSMDVFVLDNGSDDEDRRRLWDGLARNSKVQLEMSPKNIGFSAGHNRNLQRINRTTRADFIWLLNNDCIAQSGCIAHLLACAIESPETVVWGATLLEADGKHVQCAGGCRYNTWISTFRPIGKGAPIERLEEITRSRMDYVAGASIFLPADRIDTAFKPVPNLGKSTGPAEFELLNEAFFLYFEELDLARRLRREYAMGWCRDACLIHLGGLATGGRDGNRSAMAEYHSTLSALKFTRLYHPARLWFMMPARFLAKCLQLGFTGNARLIGSVLRAHRDFIAGK